MSDPLDSLATELATFNQHLPAWGTEEGRFALIAGTEVIDIFDTYADALSAGYRARGMAPFLVKQISLFGAVANFTRDLRCSWPTSASA